MKNFIYLYASHQNLLYLDIIQNPTVQDINITNQNKDIYALISAAHSSHLNMNEMFVS